MKQHRSFFRWCKLENLGNNKYSYRILSMSALISDAKSRVKSKAWHQRLPREANIECMLLLPNWRHCSSSTTIKGRSITASKLHRKLRAMCEAINEVLPTGAMKLNIELWLKQACTCSRLSSTHPSALYFRKMPLQSCGLAHSALQLTGPAPPSRSQNSR